MTWRLDPAFNVQQPSGPAVVKYLRTIQHLKLTQLVHQVRSRLAFPAKVGESVNEIAARDGVRCRSFIQASSPIGDGRSITFLNKSRSLELDSIDWYCAEESRLWRYNLHYFDYLNWDDYSNEQKADLIDSWIRSNPVGAIGAWDAYPISLRVVNWIKYFLLHRKDSEVSRAWATNLGEQTLWLEANLEYHLLANHLLKNAKALVFSGVYFAGSIGQRHLELGIKLMLQEASEQFLADGGHVERSPMYHSICLEDYLDTVNLLSANPKLVDASDLGALKETAFKGLHFIESVICGDGDIPLFNDSAFGISPGPTELMEYGCTILGEAIPDTDGRPSRIYLPETGIYGYRKDGDSFLIDCGPIGPDYQPAHGHCDTLSYELCIEGRRVVVDSGVYDYEISELRQYIRSTAAHNTVRVDGKEQSEIWKAFRVARRARPLFANLTEWQDGCCEFRGAHDGYRRLRGSPIHERQVRIEAAGRWGISDLITGDGIHLVESFVHIHPDFSVNRENDRSFIIVDEDRQIARLDVAPECDVRCVKGSYCPEFGKRIENQVLIFTLRGLLPLSLSYSIEKI